MFMKDYILLVWPGDDNIHMKPIWIALASSDSMLSTISEHFQQIRVLYLIPMSETRIVLEFPLDLNGPL
jgi:hypothetical protein